MHIPKTGGTFVRRSLEQAGWRCDYSDDGDVRDQNSLNFYRENSPQHMDGQQLESMFRLERFDLRFTICREPMARFLSEYRYRNKNNAGVSAEHWFSETAELYEENPSVLDNHFRPQANFLVDTCQVFKLEDNPQLALDAVRKILNVAHPQGEEGSRATPKGTVVRKAPLLLARLWPMKPQSRRVSTNNLAGPQPHVTESLREKIRSFYAVDYETFDYPQ